MAEAVPRQDLVQAVALNGVGFNLARAVGPAIAGVLSCSAARRSLRAQRRLLYLAVDRRPARLAPAHPARRPAARALHQRHARRHALRPPHPGDAGRHGALGRLFRRQPPRPGPCCRWWCANTCIWAPASSACAGADGCGRGRRRVCCCRRSAAISIAATRYSWRPCVRRRAWCCWRCRTTGRWRRSPCWCSASAGFRLRSVAQGAAQLAAPSWVRSRALAIYQLASNGGLVVGTFVWGWLGTRIGLPATLLAASGQRRGARLSGPRFRRRPDRVGGRPRRRPARHAGPRGCRARTPPACSTRPAGACWKPSTTASTPPGRRNFSPSWRRCATCAAAPARWPGSCYEDIAHADCWLEVWSVESWTDHLRESARTSDADRGVLARALAFHREPPPAPSRFIAVAPHRLSGTPRR